MYRQQHHLQHSLVTKLYDQLLTVVDYTQQLKRMVLITRTTATITHKILP